MIQFLKEYDIIEIEKLQSSLNIERAYWRLTVLMNLSPMCWKLFEWCGFKTQNFTKNVFMSSLALCRNVTVFESQFLLEYYSLETASNFISYEVSHVYICSQFCAISQIQGKWLWVHNKEEFERTEFILAGFNCNKYNDYLPEWLDFFLQVVNSFATHMTGAFMVFGLGTVYCWIQAVISHKMRHQATSSTLSSCTRFILSGLVTVFLIISILSLRLKLVVGITNR